MGLMINGNRTLDLQPSDYAIEHYELADKNRSVSFSLNGGDEINNMDGRLDNLLFFNKVLNESELEAVYSEYKWEAGFDNNEQRIIPS